MAGLSCIAELQSTSRVRDLVKKCKLVRRCNSTLCFVRFVGVRTRYHKVRFCAAEQLGADQSLDLGLGEGGLEVRVETILNEFFR